MKKIVSLLLALCLMLGLVACGSSAEKWQEQYDLGVRYLSEGNYEEAIIAFTAAIKIDPKQPAAFVSRAEAYLGSGETPENLAAAQADYESALELDKDNTDVWLDLADTAIKQGDREKAEEILKDALEQEGVDKDRIEEALEELPYVSSLYNTELVLEDLTFDVELSYELSSSMVAEPFLITDPDEPVGLRAYTFTVAAPEQARQIFILDTFEARPTAEELEAVIGETVAIRQSEGFMNSEEVPPFEGTAYTGVTYTTMPQERYFLFVAFDAENNYAGHLVMKDAMMLPWMWGEA